jgi:predicted RNA binding protein YcfA (HicA-like mRNA interferase family)
MGLAELKFELKYRRLCKALEKKGYQKEYAKMGSEIYKKDNEKFIFDFKTGKIIHILGDEESQLEFKLADFIIEHY